MTQNKINRFFVVLFLFTGTLTIQAQTTLYVTKQNKTQNATTLSNVRKITFTPGNVQVEKKVGTPDSYVLSEVKSFWFKTISTTDAPLVPSNEAQVYPCPASSELIVDFQATNGENVIVSIRNIQGQTVQTQIVKSVDGENNIKLDVSSLTAGLYLLSIETSSTMETKKLIISNK